MSKQANDAERTAAQLVALCHSIHGGGREAFNELSEECRDDLLALAARLAEEVHTAIRTP
jgi:hypothetical protein